MTTTETIAITTVSVDGPELQSGAPQLANLVNITSISLQFLVDISMYAYMLNKQTQDRGVPITTTVTIDVNTTETITIPITTTTL